MLGQKWGDIYKCTEFGMASNDSALNITLGSAYWVEDANYGNGDQCMTIMAVHSGRPVLFEDRSLEDEEKICDGIATTLNARIIDWLKYKSGMATKKKICEIDWTWEDL